MMLQRLAVLILDGLIDEHTALTGRASVAAKGAQKRFCIARVWLVKPINGDCNALLRMVVIIFIERRG